MSPVRDSQGRIFWGLLLIIIGFLFLVGRWGHVDIGDIFARWWPLILIAIGLWILITQNATSGIIVIVIGGFFLLARLHVFEHHLWYYFWPILLIALGLWLIARPTFRQAGGKIPEIKEDDLNASVIFSGLERRIESTNFRGGKASALFGGIELDFMNTGLASNKASVELTAIFGSIALKVPKEWQVVIDGTPVLGSIEDKHRTVPGAEAKATLYVKATAIFGSVEIKD